MEPKYSKKEDQFKPVCPLKHCPNCGSIKTQYYEDGIGGGLLVLTISILFGLLLMNTSGFKIWGIILSIILFLLGISSSVYIFSFQKCLNCNSNFSSFQYKRHIPLKEIEEEVEEERWEEI